jgi:hypothetical protein
LVPIINPPFSAGVSIIADRDDNCGHETYLKRPAPFINIILPAIRGLVPMDGRNYHIDFYDARKIRDIHRRGVSESGSKEALQREGNRLPQAMREYLREDRNQATEDLLLPLPALTEKGQC